MTPTGNLPGLTFGLPFPWELHRGSHLSSHTDPCGFILSPPMGHGGRKRIFRNPQGFEQRVNSPLPGQGVWWPWCPLHNYPFWGLGVATSRGYERVRAQNGSLQELRHLVTLCDTTQLLVQESTTSFCRPLNCIRTLSCMVTWRQIRGTSVWRIKMIVLVFSPTPWDRGPYVKNWVFYGTTKEGHLYSVHLVMVNYSSKVVGGQ